MKQLQLILLTIFTLAFAAGCGSSTDDNNDNMETRSLHETGCSATIPCEQATVCREADGASACYNPCDTSCIGGTCTDGACLPACVNGTCQNQLVCDDMDRCVPFIDEDS